MIQPMIVVTLPVLPLFVGFTLDFPLLFQASTLVVMVTIVNVCRAAALNLALIKLRLLYRYTRCLLKVT